MQTAEVSEKVVFALKKVQVNHHNSCLFGEISFNLVAGEILTIMGPSGCGKSTLLAAISGSLSSVFTFTGGIYLHGRSLGKLPMAARNVGVQFQEDLLFPHLNVEGNLLFSLARGDRLKRKEKVRQALRSAGLEGFEHKDVAALSGGQKARVGLLRTLLAEPELLLLDEPFSRLDQKLRDDFRAFVFKQIEWLKIPALLVSHDIQDCQNQRFLNLVTGNIETYQI
jgi:putative thiamine transport system ATP-binding protein